MIEKIINEELQKTFYKTNYKIEILPKNYGVPISDIFDFGVDKKEKKIYVPFNRDFYQNYISAIAYGIFTEKLKYDHTQYHLFAHYLIYFCLEDKHINKIISTYQYGDQKYFYFWNYELDNNAMNELIIDDIFLQSRINARIMFDASKEPFKTAKEIYSKYKKYGVYLIGLPIKKEHLEKFIKLFLEKNNIKVQGLSYLYKNKPIIAAISNKNQDYNELKNIKITLLDKSTFESLLNSKNPIIMELIKNGKGLKGIPQLRDFYKNNKE